MLARKELLRLYVVKGLSVSAIAKRIGCSQHKVNYWLAKSGIPKRSISDALYKRWNPKGDPFSIRQPQSIQEAILYGIGIGLYWGEGTKASKTSVRLGNSNPALIRTFVTFLVRFYRIDSRRLRFGLQVFGDMRPETALRYWMKYLRVPRSQFYPSIVVTPHRGIGNYRQKTKYGVVTIYFNNRKLRDILCNAIEEMAR
jgi:hypothetical protein